jgi:hypothetical protein
MYNTLEDSRPQQLRRAAMQGDIPSSRQGKASSCAYILLQRLTIQTAYTDLLRFLRSSTLLMKSEACCRVMLARKSSEMRGRSSRINTFCFLVAGRSAAWTFNVSIISLASLLDSVVMSSGAKSILSLAYNLPWEMTAASGSRLLFQ